MRSGTALGSYHIPVHVINGMRGTFIWLSWHIVVMTVSPDQRIAVVTGREDCSDRRENMNTN
jgi:hypothetical protein